MRLRASVQSEGELIIQLPREPMQLVANVSVLRRKGSQDDDDDNNGEREGRRVLRSARPRLQLSETTKRRGRLKVASLVTVIGISLQTCVCSRARQSCESVCFSTTRLQRLERGVDVG